MIPRLERPRWRQWLPLLIVAAAPLSGGQSHNGGGPDGSLLSLMVALPLTELLSYENLNSMDLTPSPKIVMNPIGFYQLAAAQLAMELFNTRSNKNSSMIIPELASLMDGCNNITMDELRVVDTHLNNTLDDDNATRSLTDMNAIVGPYYEIPALEWTVQATQAGIPLISHLIAHNHHNLQLHDNSQRYPSFTQISVTAKEEMEFLTQYLAHVQRTKYIAVLFPNRPSSIHQVKILWQLLEEHAITNVRLFVYQPPIQVHGESEEQQTCGPPEQEIPTVVEAIRRSGFRTIVLLGTMPQDVPLLSTAAADNQLDTGAHLWVLSSSPELVAHTTMNAPFLHGAAYLTPDEYHLHQLVMTRLQQDEAFRARVVAQALSPLSAFMEKEDSVYKPTVDSRPAYVPGMGFLFDAVMSVGLGACHQQQQLTSDVEYNLQDGIRRVEFEGASGHVRFGGASTRPGHTVPFTVLNLVQMTNSNNATVMMMMAQQSETFNPKTKQWKQVQPFEYANESTEPPALLRTIPNQNYISAGARAFGMTLFCISMATVTACAIWVWLHRDDSIVLASQPVFLYTICFASGLSGLTILIAAFDESWGLEAPALTGMCFCWTWLDAMGTTIIYSALFTKLWRTSRALQQPNEDAYYSKNNNSSTSNNNSIALWSVAWPFCLFLLAAIAIMVAMTIHSDYGWVRVVVDEESGESQGYCTGSDTLMYLFPLHTVHMIPICLSAFLALQTKEFGDTYDESKWILTLLAVQCMFMTTSVPTIFLLDEISPTAGYLGLAGFWFTIPMSCMGLLIVPKVVAVRRIKLLAAAEDPYRQSTDTTMPSVNPSTGDHDSNDGQGSDVWLSEQTPITTDGPRIQIVTFD